MPDRPLSVVLVHGAFSEASYWREVLYRLAAAGIEATAAHVDVQGFERDVAILRRHLDAHAHGDIVLVGHSYGGALISEVGAGDPSVQALVFVAAAAPVAGEPFSAWMTAHPSEYRTTPSFDASGHLWLPLEDCIQGFGHDLPVEVATLLWAVQKPVLAAAFDDFAQHEGWRSKRCWYLVTENDRLMAPDGQRGLARQMNAVTRTVASGHMVALSQPQAVTDIIIDAVRSVTPAELATATGR